MKKSVFLCSFIALALSSSAALASSNKVCFGSTKADETRGVVMTAQIDANKVMLVTLKGQGYKGTFPAYNTKVKGRDGKTYLEYKGDNFDYQDVIMIDQVLLKSGTTGLLQIRARGEGFFNSVFLCKDGR